MGHHHHNHDHQQLTTQASEHRVFWAMVITGGFMTLEVVGGLISGSLALLADAGHMFGDFASLALAWWAFRLRHKPPDSKRSFGYDRFQVLAAFVNGLTLVFIAVWICIEAISRLNDVPEIQALPMLGVAIAGLFANIGAFYVLGSGQSENLNLRGAAAHVLGDLLGSMAAIVAAILIMTLGWTWADAVLSTIVAVLITKAGVGIIKSSGHILLEGTPSELSSSDVVEAVGTVEGVRDVHHVHVWALTGEKLLATLHAVVDQGGDLDGIRRKIESLLEEQFRIHHCTVQFEFDACEGHH
ncbi:MAG: cation diffusion facilitator family transporter [Pseudomonadota bacterium]